MIILTLTTAETHQSLVLTPTEVAELPLAAAAALLALAHDPTSSQIIAALVCLADELANLTITTPVLPAPLDQPAATIVFPVQRPSG
ncbi:MAG: hypothetical protein U0401_20270 [Anaerolineae bacterium]